MLSTNASILALQRELEIARARDHSFEYQFAAMRNNVDHLEQCALSAVLAKDRDEQAVTAPRRAVADTDKIIIHLKEEMDADSLVLDHLSLRSRLILASPTSP